MNKIKGLDLNLDNYETAQGMAQNGKKAKGFRVNVQAATTTEQKITLTGDAKMILGLNLAQLDNGGAIQDAAFSLIINNEQVISEISIKDLSIDASLRNAAIGEFYIYKRMLSGSDDIRVLIRNYEQNSGPMFINICYV